MDIVWTMVVGLMVWCAGCMAQSGDSEDLVCSSHISKKGNSLTCRTVGDNDGGEDDEEDGDQIVGMTACCYDMSQGGKTVCRSSQAVSQGHVITGLAPITAKFHLTVQLKSGEQVNRTLDLAKIVKPDTPQANVTFPSRSNKAVIHVWSPYEDDYIKPTNQLFQLHIWTSTESQVYNMTSQPLVVEREYRQSTGYQVKVRAIPIGFLEGTWSDWSKPQPINSPTPGEAEKKTVSETEGGQVLLYVLTVTLVMLFLTTWGAVFLWKRKIHTYVWPDIPHPKQTFLQIYKPVKGVPVSFNPEAFLDLAVYPVERVWDPRAKDPPPQPAPRPAPRPASSGSINLRSDKLSMMQQPGSGAPPLPGGGGVPPLPGGQGLDLEQSYTLKSEPDVQRGNKDEAYVTMSSFYHVKLHQ